MANDNDSRGQRRRRGGNNPTQGALDRAASAASRAEELLTGTPEPELEGRLQVDSIVRTIARTVSTAQNRLTGGNTLETMARLKQDSLLSTPLVTNHGVTSSVKDGGRSLKDALDEVESSSVSDLFSTEKERIGDYQTYAQIADLITQAAEAINTYADNVISPDDFTKRDIATFYEGRDDEDGLILTEVRRRTAELINKYRLDDRAEEAIVQSLIKGDFFIAIFNLRQEIETLLNEQSASSMLFESAHVPNLEDADVMQLIEQLNSEARANETINEASFRSDIAKFLNETMVVHKDASHLVERANIATMQVDTLGKDLPATRSGGKAKQDKEFQSLHETKIRGSVVKMIIPENVIKLYQDDTLFGYYFVELTGPDISDFARRGGMDQTALVRAIDQNMSTRMLGGVNSIAPKGKDALIGRIIVKTLRAKIGNVAFLKDNEEFAADAYAVLARARREKRRATFTYVASDQMVHFSPNGAFGYGESVLSRVKFLAKLYLGAMTNAFMRNSIRRPERLVWYIDVGADNDDTNAIQNFIRTIKQREVKFSNLRDITTTINQIGEFHDFYVPTYNGERPVEVETLNMGNASDVDNPYLEFLRKGIVGGTGVPAAFIGYSEEVAFAKSLTMENGRFLRRVVRLQKHYGRAATRLIQLLWRNEYDTLEEILGKDKLEGETDSNGKKVKSRKGRATVVNTANATNDTESDIVRIDTLKINPHFITVRYPSPATLNMTNLADAINQATPVIDFISDMVGINASEKTKNELKRRVTKDIMPQINWERYESLLIEAEKGGQRDGAINSTTDSTASDDTESASSSSSF